MAEARRSPKGRRSAALYLRGLAILFLSHHPVRRRNLGAMCLDDQRNGPGEHVQLQMDHLKMTMSGDFLCVWPSTKNGSARVERLARALKSPILEWVNTWRPILVTDLSGTALWLSAAPSSIGGPVTPQSLSILISKEVEKRMGIHISAHDFRHIAATTIVNFAPHLVGTIPDLLHHRKFSSCKTYIQAAASAGAARVFEEVVQAVAHPRPSSEAFQRRTRRFLLGRASGLRDAVRRERSGLAREKWRAFRPSLRGDLERAGALIAQRGVSPRRIIEPVDVMSNGDLGLIPRKEDGSPDQFRFQCLEHRFDHGIIITVTLAAH